MLVNEWEIWQTFASYFIDPVKDLEKAAKNLVQSGLLQCAFIDSGDYYWLRDSKLSVGHADITLGANRSQAWVQIKSSLPEGYAREVIFDSAYFRFVEQQLFDRAKNFPPNYIRGYLGKCILISKDYLYDVFPIVKLYSTGVMLVEMRILSPTEKIGLARFVEEYVNLYKRSFDNALIPPNLRLAAQQAFELSERPKPSPLITRLGSYLLDRQIENNIKQNKITDRSGDFEFEYIYLWDPDVIEKEKEDPSKDIDVNFKVYTIYDLAKDIFQAVSIAIPGLRRGKSLLFRPNTPLAAGNFYSGRPHIHLLKYQKQALTARQNEAKYENEFGWIIGASYKRNSKLGKQFLPRNSRLFDDYGAYIAENATLWAWSRKGIVERASEQIPNNGGYVYPNQTICEVLEYGHMLYRRMFESVGSLKSPDAALKARESLVELEAAIGIVSGYGETRDLLIQGWSAMGVDRLRTAISDLITIRHTEASAKESRRLVSLQTILSLIFGILAIPAFATGVIKPLWSWLNIWQPNNQDAAEVWFFVIAFIIIELPILFITRSMLGKRS